MLEKIAEMLKLPQILDIPPRLVPIVSEFGLYKYFLIEGGRGSGKSHSIARIILYLCEHKQIRVVCGRETQNRIEESVYTLFKDLIRDFSLDFTVQSNKITHNKTGSIISFRGFFEHGSVNIKGLEGVDLLWIDEAEAITEVTYNTLIPTIRKEDCKIIFTMNRYIREDPVFVRTIDRPDTLHVHIDYYDNPHCPQTLVNEANECKKRSEKEYNHIWLGQPLDRGDDHLFSSEALAKMSEVVCHDDWTVRQRVMGIDFAAQGGDLCAACVLDRSDATHWRLHSLETWDESDSMVSIGRIINLMGRHRPTVTILDVGGMGHVVFDRLTEQGQDIVRFDGATTDGVNTTHYGNKRAEGYYLLEDSIANGNIYVPKSLSTLVRELETIRFKYKSNGQRMIVSKQDMRKDGIKSPDQADSFMMAWYGAVKHIGNHSTYGNDGGNISLTRSYKSRRY